MASAADRANGAGGNAMDDSKLVTMINQIATFHRRRPPEEAAAEVCQHLQKFWEPRMRTAIYAHVDAGGEGMDPNAKQGVILLRALDAGRLPFDPTEKASLIEPLEA